MPYYKTNRSRMVQRRNRRWTVNRYRKNKYRKRLYNTYLKKSLLGNSRIVKLKYAHVQNAQVPQLAQPAIQTWRANNVFDPQHSAGGHQPRGYDQMAELYNDYCVVASRISVNWTPHGNDENSFFCAIQLSTLDPTPSGPATSIRIAEDRHSIFGFMTPFIPKRLSKGYSTKKFFQAKNPIGDNRLCGRVIDIPLTPLHQPSLAALYHVITCNANNAVSVITDVALNTLVEYTVIFFNPKNPPVSM